MISSYMIQHANLVSKGFTGSLKINRREKHENDENCKLPESPRRINSSSQDESEICGTVTPEKLNPKRYALYQIMISSCMIKHANLVSKGFTGSLKINGREKHENDEKCKLPESPRRINSSSQDESEICIIVNGVEQVPSRIRAKHFPRTCGEKRRTAEMERTASWWATFALSLCSLSLKYSKPLLQAQPRHPLWLSIIAMLSFTLFACSATVMLLVGARFTHTQIIVMLIAFFALVLA
ncbi:uncharacterized protein LOC124827240 isoform X2 [Vigna umbellata]|uniref:uncharacterized protein LOC124827240 isoform X2 n=1 Tax=Vigna umbellata TaxID=87088 RepID=UPI001F5EBC9E|nr:uncharacterized protein LOC124827240 isoform X2 [Vigna umbellata]